MYFSLFFFFFFFPFKYLNVRTIPIVFIRFPFKLFHFPLLPHLLYNFPTFPGTINLPDYVRPVVFYSFCH